MLSGWRRFMRLLRITASRRLRLDRCRRKLRDIEEFGATVWLPDSLWIAITATL